MRLDMLLLYYQNVRGRRERTLDTFTKHLDAFESAQHVSDSSAMSHYGIVHARYHHPHHGWAVY